MNVILRCHMTGRAWATGSCSFYGPVLQPHQVRGGCLRMNLKCNPSQGSENKETFAAPSWGRTEKPYTLCSRHTVDVHIWAWEALFLSRPASSRGAATGVTTW